MRSKPKSSKNALRPGVKISQRKRKQRRSMLSFDSEGLKKLRESLRDISFRLAGLSFKSYVRGDAVWILLMRAKSRDARNGRERESEIELA